MSIVVNTDMFVERAKKIHGDRYEYNHVHYQGRFIKVPISCSKHGDFLQTPGNHLCGKGCPECKREKLSSDRVDSLEEFIRKSRKAHGDKYDYQKAIYSGSQTPVVIICPMHGEFSQFPMSHVKGHECPKCGRLKLRNTFVSNAYEFIIKARKVHGDKYHYGKVVYFKAIDKVTITCPKHGDFLQSPNKHLRGKGCPSCKETTGERRIREYLQTHGITFTPQKRFPDCKLVRPLSFDFYLPAIRIAIEYDGKQHFEPVNFTGRSNCDVKAAFEKCVQSDSVKESYCRRNGIALLRISYQQAKSIDHILNTTLGGYSCDTLASPTT